MILYNLLTYYVADMHQIMYYIALIIIIIIAITEI